MTNNEKITTILQTIRHTKGLEHLLELREGCRFEWCDENFEQVLYVVAKIYDTEDVLSGVAGFSMYAYQEKETHPQMISFDNPYDYEEQEATFYDYATIIGHPVQWSDVLVAMGQTENMIDIEIGLGPKNLAVFPNCLMDKCFIFDLTKTPEANMQSNPELTDFLYELLVENV